MNLTINGSSICEVEIADTFLTRLKGLMFIKEAPPKGLFLKKCNSIHTFFMKFNIDVVFLDKDNKVIKIIRGLKPGKIVSPVKGVSSVVEGKEGLFDDIEVGQRLSLI